MEDKAAATGSLPSRRLRFARVKPGTSALGRTHSVYIFVFSSAPLDSACSPRGPVSRGTQPVDEGTARNGRHRPPLRPTCAPSSRSTRSGRWHRASNCSLRSALRRRPRRRTRPWCTKSSVPSAAPSCDAWVTPQGPEPQPATGPAATTRSHTRATRVRRRPCARKETTRRTRARLLPTEDRMMIVMPKAAESGTNRNDHRRADLAQKDPLVEPNNARPHNTLQQRCSTGHARGEGVNLPGMCNGHPRSRG